MNWFIFILFIGLFDGSVAVLTYHWPLNVNTVPTTINTPTLGAQGNTVGRQSSTFVPDGTGRHCFESGRVSDGALRCLLTTNYQKVASDSFTINVWVKTDTGFASGQVWFVVSNWVSFPSGRFRLYLETQSGNQVKVCGRLRISIFVSNIICSNNMDLRQWTFLTLMFDTPRDLFAIYANATEIASDPGEKPEKGGLTTFAVGCQMNEQGDAVDSVFGFFLKKNFKKTFKFLFSIVFLWIN